MPKEIKITARNEAEFKKVKDLFDSFPEGIRNQITCAEFGFCSISFELNVEWGDPCHTICVPCDPHQQRWEKEGMTFIYPYFTISVKHEADKRPVNIHFLKNAK